MTMICMDSGCSVVGKPVLQQPQQDTQGDVWLRLAQSHDQDSARLPRRACFRYHRWRHAGSPVQWRQRRGSLVLVLPGWLRRRLHQRGSCVRHSGYTLKLHWLRFVVEHAVQQAVPRIHNQSTVYSKFTTSWTAQVCRKSKAHNESTASQHVKMLYSLLYDLMSNKYTTNRSSGIWATSKGGVTRMATMATAIALWELMALTLAFFKLKMCTACGFYRLKTTVFETNG